MKRTLISTAVLTAFAVGSTLFTQAQAQVLEEVVVTAQKREQSLQDVGISITAFTGDDVRKLGWEQPVDLASQTPGLSIGNALGSSNPAITIRGVGINDFNVNTNPGVAVYVDEVYQPVPATLSFGLFDLTRVEVLKGPQGTLYGRNATGGAVSFYTERPTEEFEAYIKADIGNYEYTNLEGAISGGSDRVQGRLSGIWTEQGEGHQDVFAVTGDPFVPGNGVKVGDHGKVDRYSVRGQIQVDFTDSFSGLINVTKGKDKSDSQIASFVDEDTLLANQAYYYTYWGGPTCHNCVLLDDPDNGPQVDMESTATNLYLDWDLGFATLNSVTGYLDMDHEIENDFAATELPVQDIVYGGNVEQISQELRLSSNEGELVDWIVGLYYSKTEQEYEAATDQTLGLGFLTYLYGFNLLGEPVGSATQAEQTQTSLGAFVHTEWHLTDKWKLTAAGRVSEDSLDYDAQVVDLFTTSLSDQPVSDLFNLFLGPDPITGLRTGGLIAANSDKDNTENSFSWKLGLDYAPTDDMLFYGSLSTGFKNHGFYGGLGPLSSQYVAYKPEEILSGELGFKSTLADGALQINGALYSYVLDNPQVIVSEDIGIGTPNDVLWNVKESKGWGIEMDASWVPTDSLLLRAGLSYLDSEMSDVSVTGKNLFFPLIEGAPSSYSPEWTFNGMARYDIPVSNNLNVYLQSDFDYRDDAQSFAGRDNTTIESRTLINARIGLEQVDGSWEVAIWGKNLTDEEWSGYTFQILGPMEMHQAPRTYGVSLTYNF
ncbi:MAG: TonB-dependent receptor [Pseudomonadales bacterium]